MNDVTISPIQHIGTEPERKKPGRKPKIPGQKYLSLKQASEAMNIPLDHLRVMKTLYPEGFTVNTVRKDLVKTYYDKNKDLVISKLEQGLDKLKREKLANDILLQQLEIKKQQGKMVELEELGNFLTKLGQSVSNLLLGKLVNELPERINKVESNQRAGVCKELYNEIVAKLQDESNAWYNEHEQLTK